jgi:hypothetical protein
MLADFHGSDLGPMTTEFVSAQTSVPNWLMTYCRQLAEVHYERKLNRMYVLMIESFLAYEPWKANPPFEFRLAQIHGGGGSSRKGDPGWVPMNMQLPNALVDKLRVVIDQINATYGAAMPRKLSLRTFIYTTVCWWCIVVYPYKGPGLINSQ